MEILVLDSNFQTVTIVDTFESLIWTDRYCGYGDFEIYTPVSLELLTNLQENYYLYLEESEHVMIIESVDIKTDSESGNYLIVTGRSLESVLDRRIIWEQTVLSGDFQTGIQKLLNENIISPTLTDRAVSNFIFETSTDTAITSLTIEAQYLRENLYDTILDACASNNIGFKITLSSTNQLVFKLYAGADRSYDQAANPYVIFSPNFENLLTTDYSESQKEEKNVTLVTGEGDGLEKKATIVGSGSGLGRREIYTDAGDISQTVDGVALSDEEYLSQLEQRGISTLLACQFKKAFDSQVDAVGSFKYGTDFFIGDLVQIDSGYGPQAKSRVTEVIRSQSLDGLSVCPTFVVVDEYTIDTNGELIHVSGGGLPVSSGGSSGETPTLASLGGLPISGGTMTGILRAFNNNQYTTAQVRNVLLKTSAPLSSEGSDGDICIVYV